MGPTTVCINGIIKRDDYVLSTIDSEYPCLVGLVTKIIPVWSPDHDIESAQDDVVVDFRQDYSDDRVKQIEEAFSALTGEPMAIHGCGLEQLVLSPDCLVRISGADMGLIPSFLEDEKYAIAFAYRAIRLQLQIQEKTSELRPVRGQHYENKNGRLELIPFNTGWFHRWGSKSDETEKGVVKNTVALVEMPDGVVRTVYPNHMEFIVDDKQLS